MYIATRTLTFSYWLLKFIKTIQQEGFGTLWSNCTIKTKYYFDGANENGVRL